MTRTVRPGALPLNPAKGRALGFPYLKSLLLILAIVPDATAQPTGVQLTYAIYAHGFRAMLLDATLTFDGDRYQAKMSDHTIGFVSAFITNSVHSEAAGTMANDQPHPSHFQSAGFSRGENRQTVIDYQGSQPDVTVLTPPEPNREKVPASLTPGSVDSLSAVAGLTRQIARTDRCDARFRVFDGARLTDIVSTTAGNVPVPQNNRSHYSGLALRCDFTTQLTAGFLHNENYARSHLLQHGTAWIAQVIPGAPPVPVEVQFITNDHGPIAMYLEKAQP